MNKLASPTALAPVLPAVPQAEASPAARLLAPWQAAALIFLYSAFLGLGTFALNGHYSLNLADEGFLRYGVRAIVTAGQVPMRDFQAYDPGRYYWVAAWMPLLGDGIVSTRLACTFFQVLTVGVALLALRRAGANAWALGVVGLLVTFWMIERFKLFEQCLSLAALYPAVYLVQRPDRRTAFGAGVFVGLAACLGRNHGFYNVLAFGGLLAALAYKYREPGLLKLALPWVGGIVLSYLPMLAMMVFVPGFFAAFVDSLRLLVRARATNLTIPVPWPWKVDLVANQPLIVLYHSLALSSCFVLLAAGSAVVAAVLAWLPGRRWRENAWLVAAGAVGVPYAHYAFARADGPHLAHSMPLLLVSLLGLPALVHRRTDRTKVFSVVAGGLLLLSGVATLAWNPFLTRWLASHQRRDDVTIGNDTMHLVPPLAQLVQSMQRLAKTDMDPGENILILPSGPTLYEVVGRLSPVQEIYFLWPQSVAEEQKTIRDLERNRVNWTLLSTGQMDDMPERNLPATHPLLVDYLQTQFEQIIDFPVPAPYMLLRRKTPIPAAQP